MEHQKNTRDTLAIVLGGGQGERLYPLTRDRAKPAVPFGGSYRIIDFTLSNCLNSGLRRAYVLTQYKSFSLDRHLRMTWNCLTEEIGEFVVPIPPQQRIGDRWYLGTADAIYQNIYTLEQERPARVLILGGDQIYKMNYLDMIRFHLEKRAEVTVGCVEVPLAEGPRFGVLAVDENLRIVGFDEKPASPRRCPGSRGYAWRAWASTFSRRPPSSNWSAKTPGGTRVTTSERTSFPASWTCGPSSPIPSGTRTARR